MPNRGQTIEIYLPNGEPRGVRLAGITTRIVQAIQAPKTKLGRLFERPEVNRVALYFLLSPVNNGARPRVYIGQTEDLVTRLKKHNTEKDFWTSVVAVTSKTESFTQVHVRYLEWLSIDRASAAGRFTLENGNAGGKPFIPEALESDVLDAFDTTTTLLSTLGFPVFEPPAGVGEVREPFFCRGKLGEGMGALVEDGFVLYRGSVCRREPIPSASPGVVSAHAELQSSGLLNRHSEDQMILTEDYLCSSPSLAASIVLARNANGWQEWESENGRTLDEVYRQTSEN